MQICIILVKIIFFGYKAVFTVNLLHICYSICCSCAGMSQYQYVNAISTSIDNQSFILVKHPLNNIDPGGVCIFEKVNITVGNQTVGFNSPLKETNGYAISPCKRKTKIHATFIQTGVKFALCFIKVYYFLQKYVYVSLPIILFKRYCVSWILLIFILIKFCKMFCCVRFYITSG